MKRLIGEDVRSPRWDFSLNIARAEEDGHPNVPLLEALAAVIIQHTVDQVITSLRRQYKLEQKEAEISTLTYLKQLAEKGLIGFAVLRNKGEKKK